MRLSRRKAKQRTACATAWIRENILGIPHWRKCPDKQFGKWAGHLDVLYREEELDVPWFGQGHPSECCNLQSLRNSKAEQPEALLLFQASAYKSAKPLRWKRKYRTCEAGRSAALVNGTSEWMQKTTPLKSGITLLWGVWYDAYGVSASDVCIFGNRDTT